MINQEKEYLSGFIALSGRPNVGKSTLLNKVIGHKVAIMSDKPQTTRNRILAVLSDDHSQMIFIDTPGIHKPHHKIDDIMVESALSTMKEVDIVLLLMDASSAPGEGDRFIINNIQQLGPEAVSFLVLNKIDLIDKQLLLQRISDYSQLYDFNEVIPVSALTGENTDVLVEQLRNYLQPGPQYYPDDMLVDRPEKFLMAELIREKILLLTRDEIPHSIAVVVETVQEREFGKLYVGATVYVEKDSQKGIIIGRKGSMLREIGQQARNDIEKLLGTPIYLELWVKVKKDWRNRIEMLRNFGLSEDD